MLRVHVADSSIWTEVSGLHQRGLCGNLWACVGLCGLWACVGLCELCGGLCGGSVGALWGCVLRD